MNRPPETIEELKAEILRQLKESEEVTIILTEGDGIHELIESISDGIRGTKHLNEVEGSQYFTLDAVSRMGSHGAVSQPI